MKAAPGDLGGAAVCRVGGRPAAPPGPPAERPSPSGLPAPLCGPPPPREQTAAVASARSLYTQAPPPTNHSAARLSEPSGTWSLETHTLFRLLFRLTRVGLDGERTFRSSFQTQATMSAAETARPAQAARVGGDPRPAAAPTTRTPGHSPGRAEHSCQRTCGNEREEEKRWGPCVRARGACTTRTPGTRAPPPGPGRALTRTSQSAPLTAACRLRPPRVPPANGAAAARAASWVVSATLAAAVGAAGRRGAVTASVPSPPEGPAAGRGCPAGRAGE